MENDLVATGSADFASMVTSKSENVVVSARRSSETAVSTVLSEGVVATWPKRTGPVGC